MDKTDEHKQGRISRVSGDNEVDNRLLAKDVHNHSNMSQY